MPLPDGCVPLFVAVIRKNDAVTPRFDALLREFRAKARACVALMPQFAATMRAASAFVAAFSGIDVSERGIDPQNSAVDQWQSWHRCAKSRRGCAEKRQW
jgi:hypothetical protein